MKAEFENQIGAGNSGCGARVTVPGLRSLMFCLLLSSFILHPSSFSSAASLSSPALSPTAAPFAPIVPVGPPGTQPDIRGIVPPQPFFIGAFGGLWLALAVVALMLAAYALWRFRRARPEKAFPPPNPRDVAARRLAELEQQMESMDARTFGGAVAEVLRAYIGGQYGLHPERQTSPEFLASITGSRVFTLLEHSFLSEFLEGCDLLKFARQDATLEGKRRLVSQALGFVKSSATPIPDTPPPLPQALAAG